MNAYDTIGCCGLNISVCFVSGAAECTYVLQEGDTLELVAAALQTTPAAILEVNPRITQELLRQGLSLQLPQAVACPSEQGSRFELKDAGVSF